MMERVNDWTATIWALLVYIIYLFAFFILLRRKPDSMSFLITSLIIVITIGKTATSFIPNKLDALDFELKFYSPIIIGILAGVVASFYTTEEIKDLPFQILVVVFLILIHGGFMFIEYRKNKALAVEK